MRIPALLLALLMLSPAVAMAQTAQFTSPAENTRYSKTSNIGFTCSGGTANDWYTVRAIQAGTVVQEISVQAGANGSFGGTLNASSAGWSAGDLELKLLKGANEEDSVTVEIQGQWPGNGGGLPTGGT